MVFAFAGCEGGDIEAGPDSSDVVRKIGMVYGDDETPITLTKPDSASFTFYGDDPMDSGDLAGICADDYSWDAEIMGYKYYEGIGSNVPFVDYYFAGAVSDEYTSYEEEIKDLGISFGGNPVKVIRYSYTEVDYEDVYEEIFVGFEYSGSSDQGLFGLKINAYGEELSDNYLKNLFNELTILEK